MRVECVSRRIFKKYIDSNINCLIILLRHRVTFLVFLVLSYYYRSVSKSGLIGEQEREMIMSCRIGMTTNLERRKIYWKSQYPTLKDWQVLAGPIASKDEAQKKETELAKEYACESHPGGDDPDKQDALWYIYGFNY